ncbi:MAG: cation:proton antiporter [Dehalococcoidia bacterium]
MAGILLLLGLAMAGALLARAIRVPYTVVLVVLGLVLGVAGVQPGLNLDRDLILHVFLPLLLFEASLQVDLTVLWQTLAPIALLAVPGVVLSALLIGAALHVTTGLAFAGACLFGALISATDPVAVLALFKRLHAPAQLAMLVEGESVVNDGTALVLFTLLLPVARGAGFSLGPVAVRFIAVLAGGIAVGAVCGWVGAIVVRWFDDHLAELTVSALVAYGSFLLAERLNVSGVIGTVVAGLVFSTFARHGLTEAARESLIDLWEFGAFVANSLLFILLGLKVSAADLFAQGGDLAWALLAALIARAAIVYGLALLLRWRRRPLMWRYNHLVFWSGLRGALAIALALSLPPEFSSSRLLLRLTAGVVLFTLLVQGATVEPLLRWSVRRSEE